MNNLTPKQSKLVEGLSRGLKKQKAGQEAGYGNTPGSTSAIVTETLKNPKVRDALEPFLDKHNLTVDRALKPLNKALEATKMNQYTGEITDDLDLQIKASDRVLRLRGIGSETNIAGLHLHLHNQRDKYQI